MTFPELFLIALGLSMDAFAVSISKGLSFGKFKLKNALTVGLYFGVFQGVMPLIGYFFGSQFANHIKSIDHWIAFILLILIGGNMIKESIKIEECEKDNSCVTVSAMLPLAIATSIDALAVGVSFAFLNVNIFVAVCFIGVITFVTSSIGVKIGSVFGTKYKSKAEFLGGAILILMGFKILFEHLEIFS